jgi:glycosyltransferase involved in cell wall biosynthesis
MPGGVSALYSSLDLENIGIAKYFTLYFEKKESSIFDKFKRLTLKYFEFNSAMKKYEIVIINPSLTLNSFFRDSIFALLVKIRSKKLVVFWHGWEDDIERKIKNSIVLSWLFRNTFGHADGIVVLGSIFQKKLLDLCEGKNSKFLFFQNVAEFKLIEGKDVRVIKRIGKEMKILFISRIEKNKGALEAIKIFWLIKSNLPNHNVYLTVAGEGSELENVKAYVYKNNIENVCFPGHVKGLDKHNLLINSHFLLFPSASEGLPLVILEGMSYGLPIISSPRGGIPDIIKESINGFLIEPSDIDQYVNKILKIVSDEKLYSSISLNNYNYSKQHLTPEIAREKLITFCKKIYS